MPFPKKYAELAARTRVPAGFAVVVAFLWLATPTAATLAVGGVVGALGVAVRAWAAGHLEKNQELAVSGPYAHVRNPLYVGTLLTGVGFALAGAHIAIGLALIVFFVLFYLPVVDEEERHLAVILPGYDDYRRRVPRLWPSLTPRYRDGAGFRLELYLRNREYQALLGYLATMALLLVKYALR
jgi:protein-S-isoprenylcysteine O-methyltransferase Ste14